MGITLDQASYFNSLKTKIEEDRDYISLLEAEANEYRNKIDSLEHELELQSVRLEVYESIAPCSTAKHTAIIFREDSSILDIVNNRLNLSGWKVLLFGTN